MQDKEFHTYRKSKVLNEDMFFRWNPLNFINKHYVRGSDDNYQSVREIESINFSVTVVNVIKSAKKDLLAKTQFDSKYRQRVYDFPLGRTN